MFSKFPKNLAHAFKTAFIKNENIKKYNPRWYTDEEIKNKGWKLKEKAESVELKIWDENQECTLTKFYNATDIEEEEEYQIKWQ